MAGIPKWSIRRRKASGLLALAVIATLFAADPIRGQAPAQSDPAAQQTAAPTATNSIAGTWQGTLHAGRDLRIVVKITNEGGAVKATMHSIDQGGQGIPSSSASFAGGTLKFAIQFLDASYEGKLSGDGKSIAGTWTQADHPLPLVLERATPETEWAIPEPPPRIPPMAADAKPGIEVATIKPSQPGEQRRFITFRGREIVIVGFTLNDVIKFAYDVQEKQILNGPAWLGSDRFDINAQPDQPGTPSPDQFRSILQKLLTDRFALKFHKEKKEMSAYVLTVGKDGPKMTKATDPSGLPGLFFGPLGTLHVVNATMGDFCGLMQSAVLDRPVVDRTGLDGKWNFILKWTPDESQFTGLGVKVPPPTDAADAAPPLFTAIQEQLDMKLDAQKTAVDVMVLDHVDHPSPN